MTLAFSMRFSALEGIGRPRLNCLALAGPHCGVVYDDLLRKTCARPSMLPSKIEKPIHIPAPGAAEAHPPGFPVYGRLPPPCASVRPRHRRPRPLGLPASGGLALDAPTPSACGADTPEPPSAALMPHSASARVWCDNWRLPMDRDAFLSGCRSANAGVGRSQCQQPQWCGHRSPRPPPPLSGSFQWMP